MKRFLIPVLIMVAAVVLAACGGDDPTPTPVPPTPTSAPTADELALQEYDRVLAAALVEGAVDVWTGGGGNAARDHLEGAFEAAFPGIDVTLFQAPRSSERDSRYLQEREAGVASLDIFVGGSAGVNARVKPADGLQPLAPFLILPEVTDLSNWQGGEWIWVDDEKTYMMMSAATTTPSVAIADSVDINSLQTWRDLLKPEFQGKIIMQDPRESGAGFARGLFWYNAPRHDQPPVLGPEFTKQFYSTSGVVFSPDRRSNLEQVVNEKMLINISPDITEWKGLRDIGKEPRLIATLGMNSPTDGVAQASDSSGILFVPNIDLPHPNAAKVYANWFYSQAGQQELANIRNSASRRVDVDLSALEEFTVPTGDFMNLNHHTASELVTQMRDDVTANLP